MDSIRAIYDLEKEYVGTNLLVHATNLDWNTKLTFVFDKNGNMSKPDSVTIPETLFPEAFPFLFKIPVTMWVKFHVEDQKRLEGKKHGKS